MANPWFKFYGSEYLGDQKMLALSASERSCWLTLLCYASQNDGVIKHLNEETLMAQAGIPLFSPEWEKTKGVLVRFTDLDMIQVCNGIVTLTNWDKRQYSEGYSRVKNFRKRNCNAKDNDREDKIRIDKIRKEEKEQIELPIWLNKKAWGEWEKYRKELKKPLKPSTLALQVKFLSEHQADHAAIIKQSIQNGWTGLFALKQGYKNDDHSRAWSKRADEIKAKREFAENAAHNEAVNKAKADLERLAASKKI